MVALRPAIIEISRLDYDNNAEEHLKNWRENNIPCPKINGFSVSFEGYQEGSAFPIDTEKDALEHSESIQRRYANIYKFKIINKIMKVKQTTLFSGQLNMANASPTPKVN